MIALLYDVHGNLPALEAVVADAEEQGADRWILGGDYALFGGWPAETVARLRELAPATWIRGNGERWTADPARRPTTRSCRERSRPPARSLGEATVAELAALPADVEHEGALVCHGSPPSDVRSFLPEPADDEAELLEGVTHARVYFGHTHLPFRRVPPSAASSSSTPARSGCRSTATRRAAYALAAPRTARSSTAASPTTTRPAPPAFARSASRGRRPWPAASSRPGWTSDRSARAAGRPAAVGGDGLAGDPLGVVA